MPTNRAPDISLFKGSPILTIWTGRTIKGEEEYIRFGSAKAAAICDHIDHIRRFAEQTEKRRD